MFLLAGQCRVDKILRMPEVVGPIFGLVRHPDEG
jgi:hypothetical protein